MCITTFKGELLKIEILKRARRLTGVLNILIDAPIGLGSTVVRITYCWGVEENMFKKLVSSRVLYFEQVR